MAESDGVADQPPAGGQGRDPPARQPPPAPSGSGNGGRIEGGGVGAAQSHEAQSVIERATENAVKRELRWPETIMAGFTVVIAVAAIAQCHEMNSGGVDTHKLADSTNSLYDATNKLADAEQRQETDTNKLVIAAQAQAAATNNLRDAARDEALAMAKLRDAGQAQADATSHLRDIASHQLAINEETERPRLYISSSDPVTPLAFTAQGVDLTIQFTINNSGESDAQFAYPFGEFYVRSNDAATVHARQKSFCDRVRARDIIRQPIGTMIARGQTTHENAVVHMNSEELDKWKRTSAAEGAPFVAGCLDYIYDGKHHQTSFAYEIDRLQPGQPNPFGVIDPTKGNVNAGEIALAIHPWFSGQSD
jgi:hypothetical protein